MRLAFCQQVYTGSTYRKPAVAAYTPLIEILSRFIVKMVSAMMTRTCPENSQTLFRPAFLQYIRRHAYIRQHT
jgi:hypothetical protein